MPPAIDDRPYLTSIGVAIPRLGFSKHFYIHTKRDYRLTKFNRYGVCIVRVSYRRLPQRQFG